MMKLTKEAVERMTQIGDYAAPGEIMALAKAYTDLEAENARLRKVEEAAAWWVEVRRDWSWLVYTDLNTAAFKEITETVDTAWADLLRAVEDKK